MIKARPTGSNASHPPIAAMAMTKTNTNGNSSNASAIGPVKTFLKPSNSRSRATWLPIADFSSRASGRLSSLRIAELPIRKSSRAPT